MKMSNDKKKELLLKNFDILKDNYDKNKSTLATVIVKMLKIDTDTAVDMWSYLVTKHVSKLKSDDSWFLTGNIVYEGHNAIGKPKMAEIILGNPVLKKALFSQAGGDSVYLFVGWIIASKINSDELQLADELLSMVYKNKNKEDSWYTIMDDIIPDDPDDLEVSEEAYELLEMWCDKVKDAEERASLSVKMMEFMD